MQTHTHIPYFALYRRAESVKVVHIPSRSPRKHVSEFEQRHIGLIRPSWAPLIQMETQQIIMCFPADSGNPACLKHIRHICLRSRREEKQEDRKKESDVWMHFSPFEKRLSAVSSVDIRLMWQYRVKQTLVLKRSDWVCVDQCRQTQIFTHARMQSQQYCHSPFTCCSYRIAQNMVAVFYWKMNTRQIKGLFVFIKIHIHSNVCLTSRVKLI